MISGSESEQIAVLIERARPAGAAWLLLRVVISNDTDAAMAWRQWSAARATAKPSPAEARLMPSVAERLTQLGLSSGLPNEILVARRDTFIANHARLSAARPLLERLSAAVPVMLLKGGARIAANPKDEHLRMIRDIDLLFRPEDLSRALEIAIGAGYRSVSGLLPGLVKSRALAPVFAAGEARRNHIEVDFHAMPLRLGQTGFHDTELWQRAVDGRLLGLTVKVPAASDRFVQAIAHGLVADDDKPADWIVDVAVALRDPLFDAQVAAREIRRRRLGLPVAVASALLGELGIKVSEVIVAACRGDVSNALYRWEFAATLKPTRAQTLIERGFVFGAELHRSFFVRARNPSWNTSWLAVPALQQKGNDWSGFVAGRATLTVDGIGGDHLLVRFTGIPREPQRPSFDILLDNIWIGRVRFRWLHRLVRYWPRSWRAGLTFRLPAGMKRPNPTRFTIIALDEQKMPTRNGGEGILVTIENVRL